RQWDANKAEIMFKKCIQWRRQNNLKEYQQPEILQKYFHNMCIGNDKEGCPIIYIPIGKVDANAPSLFSIPYRIVKNFLAPETQEKIEFFSTEGWQEKLLELIDTDVLPAFMGGTRTDPDGNPYCKTLVMQMGIIDGSYYLAQDGDNSLAHVPGVNTLLVPRSSTKRILLRAENVGCVIEWEFEVKAGDIGFGLFLEKTPDERTPVVVLDRVDAKDCVVTGVYNCEKRGNYYAEFDNLYSWIKSKKILYIFKIYSNESWKRN
ncbi:hypothetical protein JTE90_009289, partial [Oedothorax gibbosus]